jgi:HEAT repeat protein
LAERRERRERLADEYYAQLDDEDPAVRAEAAEGLTADDSNIPALSELAANDPDFRVRAAAVSALGGADAGDSLALGALIGALGDPDPEVLVPALEGLQWVADSSVIPEITPLLDHPNEDVRDTAGITIDLLED